MNDVIKVLKERRSVRKFKGDMPPKDLLMKLLKRVFMRLAERGSSRLLLLP